MNEWPKISGKWLLTIAILNAFLFVFIVGFISWALLGIEHIGSAVFGAAIVAITEKVFSFWSLQYFTNRIDEADAALRNVVAEHMLLERDYTEMNRKWKETYERMNDGWVATCAKMKCDYEELEDESRSGR